MRVLLWHVHGSWTTSFVQGPHTYLLPVLPDRGPDGRGRARTWQWPPSAVEVTPDEARRADIDVAVLQRPEELHELCHAWTGRRPGLDVPAVYLEHNAPDLPVGSCVAVGERDDIPVVHVSWFNQLMWDSGRAPSVVIEHGVVDPGYRYSGEIPAAAVVVNEPIRRGRVTGTDLLPLFRQAVPVDVFGMGTEQLGGADVDQATLHERAPRRRVYLHPYRWTSLGLSLIEAMHLGMPVVSLATTEAGEAVPPEAGVVSNRLDRLTTALQDLVADPDRAAAMGRRGREAALARYGLARFLADWDRLLGEAVR